MKIRLEHEGFVNVMQLKQAGFADAVAAAVKSCLDIVLAAAVDECPKESKASREADLLENMKDVPEIPKGQRTSQDDPSDDGRALAQSLGTQYIKTGRAGARGCVGSPLMRAIYAHEGTGLYARGGNGRPTRPWLYGDEQDRLHLTYGTESTPFLETAMNATREECKQRFAEMISEALKNG